MFSLLSFLLDLLDKGVSAFDREGVGRGVRFLLGRHYSRGGWKITGVCCFGLLCFEHRGRLGMDGWMERGMRQSRVEEVLFIVVCY